MPLAPELYTSAAWKALQGAVAVAKALQSQFVETEHLLEALLESKASEKLLAKLNVKGTASAASVRAWAARQPRIVGAAPAAEAGRSLTALLPVAQGIAKEFLDSNELLRARFAPFLTCFSLVFNLFRGLATSSSRWRPCSWRSCRIRAAGSGS